MIRHQWTPRMLARTIGPSGLFGRPSLMFRMRPDKLPSVLPPYDGSYRPYELAEHWPADWAALFMKLSKPVGQGDRVRGWKYVDLWPGEEHFMVHLLGYNRESMRPMLPNVVEVITGLQARGLRVEVR